MKIAWFRRASLDIFTYLPFRIRQKWHQIKVPNVVFKIFYIALITCRVMIVIE